MRVVGWSQNYLGISSLPSETGQMREIQVDSNHPSENLNKNILGQNDITNKISYHQV